MKNVLACCVGVVLAPIVALILIVALINAYADVHIDCRAGEECVHLWPSQ